MGRMLCKNWSEPSETCRLNSIDSTKYERIIFFTGAGMSVESGIPTYRGLGGVWEKYNWEEYACEDAFQRNPGKVFGFHEIRRQKIGVCIPHKGYEIISVLQKSHDKH